MSTPRLAFLLILLLALAIPANAAADQLTVDFETGPALRTPVNDDYAASAFVSFPQDPGFRPYRTDVAPGKAHSGTVVADIGGDLCQLENTGDAQDCEFPVGGTTGRLSRTATAVTVFAGTLEDQPQPTTVRLVGHRTNGALVKSADVAIDVTGINKRLSVSSAAGDIDSFTLTTTGGSDLAIDDLTMDYPANSLPDVVPSTSNQVFKALQGDSTEIPLTITRVNGSKGPVNVSVSGLPKGVTANAHGLVAGEPTSITLTAADDAPVDFTPRNVTITVDPLGNAKVAPAARKTTASVRVATSQDVRLPTGASPDVALPACAATDVPVVVDRDISFASDVTLTVDKLPSGVSAQVLPSATVAPGGALAADRTIRFTRTTTADLPADVTVRSTGPAKHERTVALHLTKADGRATVSPGFGRTPRLLSSEGTKITVSGNGFCPGTQVQIGNEDAVLTPTLVDDHTMTFTLPRNATSGPVAIEPPGDFTFDADNQLVVDNFRNTDGFRFKNFDFSTLGIDELADAFGADDLFVSVNPCGVWGGNCRIQTGILDPIAAIDWGILNVALQGSAGHCFGISRAVEQFTGGKKPLRTFTTGGTVYSIPSDSGPGGLLTGYLDGQHALQGSDEYLHAYFRRPSSLKTTLAVLTTALSQGDFPIVAMRQGFTGHAVVAYNMRPTATGADIDVYDSNRQIQPGEDGSATIHREYLDGSVIHVDTTNGRWSFDRLSGKQFRGGNDKTLFVSPSKTIPQDPSLPGLSVLNEGVAYLIFGSADGSVRTTGSPSGADYMPALDDNAAPGTAGTLISDGTRPIANAFTGVKDGRYSSAFVGKGFAGSVSDVATKRGVRDELRGSGDQLTFNGGEDRPLTFELAQQPPRAGTTAWAATLRTQASAKGADSAALTPGGTVTYVHDGKPAMVTLALSSLAADGPTRFESGALRVAAGDRVTIVPAAGLATARVTIRHRSGVTGTRVLRNQAKPPARLTLSRPRVSGSRAQVRVRVAGLRSRASMGVVVRLLRGGRVVARRSAGVTKVRNGIRTFTFSLPPRARGRYRVLANARLITTATKGAPTAARVSAGTRAQL